MNCAEVHRFIDAYIDQEIDPQETMQVDSHISACAACRTRIEVSRRMKREIHARLGNLRAPARLEERVRAQLHPRPFALLFKPIVMVPVAAAAAALLVFVLVDVKKPVPAAEDTAVAGATMVNDFLRPHLVSLPLDVQGSDQKAVSEWFKGKVDFPVRPPVFKAIPASLVGGRLSNVRQNQAAQLRYNLWDQDVGVTIFHPESPLLLPGSHILNAMGKKVLVTRRNGYTVALFQANDIAYAVSGHLSEEQLISLVSSLEP